MKSNEDVDWGVIFSEASVCVRHRHVFEQKQLGGELTHTHFTHSFVNEH